MSLNITICCDNPLVFKAFTDRSIFSNAILKSSTEFPCKNNSDIFYILDLDNLSFSPIGLQTTLKNNLSFRILCISKDPELLDIVRALNIMVEKKPLTDSKAKDFLDYLVAELPATYKICEENPRIYDNEGKAMSNAETYKNGFEEAKLKKIVKDIPNNESYIKSIGLPNVPEKTETFTELQRKTRKHFTDNALTKYREQKLLKLNLSPLEFQKKLSELELNRTNGAYRQHQKEVLEKLRDGAYKQHNNASVATIQQPQKNNKKVLPKPVIDEHDSLEELAAKRDEMRKMSRHKYVEESMFRPTEDESKYYTEDENDQNIVDEVIEKMNIANDAQAKTLSSSEPKRMSLMDKVKIKINKEPVQKAKKDDEKTPSRR